LCRCIGRASGRHMHKLPRRPDLRKDLKPDAFLQCAADLKTNGKHREFIVGIGIFPFDPDFDLEEVGML